MSLRRKTYDGDIFGRGTSITEWRDPFNIEGKNGKPAASKRSTKHVRLLELEDTPFTEDAEKDRYLITYADLITLLLGLFIILYSISNVDVQKFSKMISAMGNFFGNDGKIIGLTQNQNVIDVSPISNLKSGLDKVIKDNGYESSIRLEENERGITLHILEDILFASGKSELNDSSGLVLSKIAAIIRELPNDVRVEGHTDNIPIKSVQFPSNWHLSVARALSTAYYLIHNEGLSPEKVSVVGYSEYKPIADNTTLDGRSQNRRVDIVIIKK